MLQFINTILLMSQPANGQKQSPMMSILFLVLIVVVFYFFMIRPQVKKQKEVRKFREALKKGDKVITTGGMYGKISDIKETHALIEIAPEIRVKVDLSAILRDASDLEQKK